MAGTGMPSGSATSGAETTEVSQGVSFGSKFNINWPSNQASTATAPLNGEPVSMNVIYGLGAAVLLVFGLLIFWRK